MPQQKRRSNPFLRMRFENDFDRQIETEIMESERLRAGFLVIVFSIVMLLVVVVRFVFPDQVEQIFHGRFNFLPPALILAAYALYEALYRFLIGLFARKGLRFPTPPRYLNATVEASFPTLILFLLFLILPPELVLSLPTVLVYFLFIGLSALRLDPFLAVYTGLVSGVGYLIVSLYFTASPSTDPSLFPGSQVSKALIMVGAGLITMFVSGQIKKKIVHLFQANEERNKVKAVFGQHVSPAVVDRLLSQDIGVESETRRVCMMFLDIRNFTSFSQNLPPEEVVAFLNRLFPFMIDVINLNHGFINKFLGDGFMAVFGAPVSVGQSSFNAVKASLEISDRLQAEIAAGTLHETKIGIGLHTGNAVTGSVGSVERKEYTIIGDVVNLASRIEQLNKQYESEILLSREVWDEVDPASWQGPPVKSLGLVTVKGRDKAVEILQLR